MVSHWFDYGPLRTYEITWKSGHVETVQGHQVTFDSWRLNSSYSGLFGGTATITGLDPRFSVHGEFDGHWRLVVTAPESELHSIRDITGSEIIPDSSS